MTDMNPTVKFKKLIPSAVIPVQAHPGDAGLDLVAAETAVIKPMARALIHTGLAAAIPEGYEGQVRPRSGLAIKYGVTVLNTPGTVDSGYRGELCVILANFGQEDFTVEPGMRIAQMVIAAVSKVDVVTVEELDETERGTGGFGSTGTK